MPFLTILTPTYNRAKYLQNAFDSLLQQTNKNFIWMIVDDGSSDNTKELIEIFRKKADFKLCYLFKENGGKHTALNLGIKNISTPYTIILDSDDTLTTDAVEIIQNKWQRYKGYPLISSVVFLRGYTNTKVIGDTFPEDGFISNHIECRLNIGVKGDKAETYRTEILKEYQFPEVKGEKFIGEGVLWNKIGKKYSAVYFNKIIYITEYLDHGLTKSGRKLRAESPIGGILYANECMSKEFNTKIRIKYSILHGCYSLLAKHSIKSTIKNSNNPKLTVFFMPLSFILYLYWKKKY